MIELRSIPSDAYPAFRREAIFACCKWDPQVGDANVIADQALVISSTIATKLAGDAEALCRETLALEAALIRRPDLQAKLGLPRAIRNAIRRADGALPSAPLHVMRFDFHPCGEAGTSSPTWSISEVNRDVPGGFGESSILPRLAAPFFAGTRPFGDVSDSLARALSAAAGPGGRIGFVHATAYTDDRQVMEFLARRLTSLGHTCLMLAPDHVQFAKGRCASVQAGTGSDLQALFRFFPAEWLPSLPRLSGWQGFFEHTVPACNHGTAFLTQSKRLPCIWDELSVPVPTWRQLLPETRAVRRFRRDRDPDWFLKTAFGRVGDGVMLPGVATRKELRQSKLNATLFPAYWIAQRAFKSLPLPTPRGPAHVCLGVYTVNGVAAGFYGRISARPRIDQHAQDIAVLVQPS